jgi:hypothetical protein
MPIGEGGTGTPRAVAVVVVGDVGNGRAGKEGPPVLAEDKGDGWRREGEGEWREGEPDESVDALKG